MNDDLNKFLEKQLNDKYEKELENIHKKIDRDKAVIEEALDLINKHILYKKIIKHGYPTQYVLVTPEMFKQDYLTEPEHSYDPDGVQFLTGCSKPSYKAILRVNGIEYFDIRYALNTFEESVRKAEQHFDSVSCNLTTKLKEAKDEVDGLYKSLPNLKQAINDWLEYQEEHKDDYEVW